MKIKFTKFPTTEGTVKVSLDGGNSFKDYSIADIYESGITLSDYQDYEKIQIQAPANVLKNLNVISKIIVDDSQALGEEPPSIEYYVSKSSSGCCGDSLILSITKGRSLFEILRKSGYAEFVYPEWFHINDDSVNIDGRKYDYGENDHGSYSYRTPDSDGVQYEFDEEWAEKYDSFMSNYEMARDRANQEIVSILSRAKIGFRIDGMWIPMVFI